MAVLYAVNIILRMQYEEFKKRLNTTNTLNYINILQTISQILNNIIDTSPIYLQKIKHFKSNNGIHQRWVTGSQLAFLCFPCSDPLNFKVLKIVPLVTLSCSSLVYTVVLILIICFKWICKYFVDYFLTIIYSVSKDNNHFLSIANNLIGVPRTT